MLKNIWVRAALIGSVIGLVMAVIVMMADKPAPQLVPKEQIAALVTCMVTDKCKEPRVDLVVNGKPAWAITTDYSDGTLMYMVSGDLKLRIWATTSRGSVMVVDSGTGAVEAFVEEFPGHAPREFNPGDQGFKAKSAAMQVIYFEAMQEAAKRVIPKPEFST
jgi:hypothetical protein